MKTFEVAVPLQYCKKVIIEPSDEFGEMMVVYTFPLENVYLRGMVGRDKFYFSTKGLKTFALLG